MPSEQVVRYGVAFCLGLLLLALMQRMLRRSRPPRRPLLLTMWIVPGGVHHAEGTRAVAGPLHAQQTMATLARNGLRSVATREGEGWLVTHGRHLTVNATDRGDPGGSAAVFYLHAGAPLTAAADAEGAVWRGARVVGGGAVRRFPTAADAAAAIPPGHEAQHVILFNGANDPTYYLVEAGGAAVATTPSGLPGTVFLPPPSPPQ